MDEWDDSLDEILAAMPMPTGGRVCFVVFFVIFTAFIVIKSKDSMAVSCVNGKMVNGSLFYRALESVSIASALSAALAIYSCQIRVHQR